MEMPESGEDKQEEMPEGGEDKDESIVERMEQAAQRAKEETGQVTDAHQQDQHHQESLD
jgi:hypothetical protein